MRKLEEFSKSKDNLLSKNELLNISGGEAAYTSRYHCYTDTASAGCTDTRHESTIDENGISITTVTEYDN